MTKTTDRAAQGPSPLLAIYLKLHDGLTDMIESGRLAESDIPEDYLWLCDTLEQAVILGNTLEDAKADCCRKCGEAADNGEGWDGLCGNCADKAERGQQ